MQTLNTIATQRTIEWIQVQRAELESKITTLTDELSALKKEHEEFTSLLIKLSEDNSNTINNEENVLNCSSQTAFSRETINVSNSDDLDCYESYSEEMSNHLISEIDEDDYENEINDYEEDESDHSSPGDWLRPEYQNRPMEDVVFEILKQIQPAKPGDIALKLYEIEEYDPNFDRARNSANAALTNGKKAGKWKLLRRGVYVLNDYPESFNSTISRNGHHQAYQIA